MEKSRLLGEKRKGSTSSRTGGVLIRSCWKKSTPEAWRDQDGITLQNIVGMVSTAENLDMGVEILVFRSPFTAHLQTTLFLQKSSSMCRIWGELSNGLLMSGSILYRRFRIIQPLGHNNSLQRTIPISKDVAKSIPVPTIPVAALLEVTWSETDACPYPGMGSSKHV